MHLQLVEQAVALFRGYKIGVGGYPPAVGNDLLLHVELFFLECVKSQATTCPF